MKYVKKVNKSLSPLYPIAQYLPRHILDQIYKTYIRPHFDYCDIIYDGHITIYDAARLETLQNRAARLTTGTLFRTSSDKLRLELGWDKLSSRRRMHKLILYHKLSQPEALAPRYLTEIMPHTREQDTNRKFRNATTHSYERAQTTSYKRSFFILANKLYNELPDVVRSLRQNKFNKHITEQLGTPQPPEFYALGSKTGNILHTRLRNEMSGLNSHLFKIQRTTAPSCPCGHNTESVRHYLLECSLYTNQRNTLFNNIRLTLNCDLTQHSALTQLQILLRGTHLDSGDGRTVAYHLQTFILNSRRFTLV